MKNFKNVLTVVLFLIGATLYAQTNLTGKVVDELNQPLPGADVIIKGTTQGTSTDFDGNFVLTTSNSNGTLRFSFMGYNMVSRPFNGTKNFGTVLLEPSAESLSEVVIVGVADIAKERETPVAVSTIKATEIVEKLGSQELPELLNSTPSVYATKSGGGFGDSRINIRGFDQRNTAVMINGMPVNDMENGWVYWSNWAGLADVTSAMQVQRGLGSSKLAISSVGGTINVLTKSSNKKQGGSVSGMIGNANYLKTVISYNTGKMDSGFSSSILLGRSAGDGYVDGTQFEGYNYYLAFGLERGNHDLQLTVTGAPQTHNQRTTSFYNMAKLSDYQQHGNKYNYNHGYLDGEEFNWRKNFYHKPIASLNWDWALNDASKINSVFYASAGRGGGTGDIGVGPGYGFASSSRYRNEEGLVDWDKLVAYNSGEEVEFYNGNTYQLSPDSNGDYITSDWGDGIARRASMNSHNWFGLISNFNHKLNESLTLDFGVDMRSYKGIHYRRLNNLLGADAYIDDSDINNPNRILTTTYPATIGAMVNVFASIDEEEKIAYYNEGKVRWYGAFTQLEYKKDAVSLFLQAGGSNQGFQRIDYFTYEDSDPNQTSEWVNILGGNIKGGLNFNINEQHNVFANAGYYSKQPGFDAIFLNHKNDVNEDRKNENVIGMEVGYGFRSEKSRLNLNVYRTSWDNRFIRVEDEFGGVEGNANIHGVKQIHMGVELDTEYRPIEGLKFMAMGSVGDWRYQGTYSGPSFDTNQNLIGETTLYLDDVRVGDAAQITARLAMEWKAFKNFKIDISQFYADKLYAKIDAASFNNEGHKGSLKLPSYSKANAGISYKFNFTDKIGANVRFNVNNLFDTEYISESATNYHAEEGDNVFRGIKTNNKVFFGFGRTWNASVRFNF